MGESRGGEGRAGGPTVIQALSSILRSYRDEGREIESLVVRRVSGPNCSLEVRLWGEPEAEEIIYFGFDDPPELQEAIPIRDNRDQSEEG